jgi:hypothetical protein
MKFDRFQVVIKSLITILNTWCRMGLFSHDMKISQYMLGDFAYVTT